MAKPTDPNETMRRAQPSWWQVLLALLAFSLFSSLLLNAFGPAPRELSYTEFKERIRQGEVAEVTITGDHIRGRFKSPATEESVGETNADSAQGGERGDQKPNEASAETTTGRPTETSGEKPSEEPTGTTTGQGEEHKQEASTRVVPGGDPFVTTKPRVDDPNLLDQLEEHGVTVKAESPEPSWWQRALSGLLPWILILGIFFYLINRMQQSLTASGDGGPGGIFGFARSKAKRFREEVTKTTLEDVAGLENAKRDVREIVDNLANPERYRALGAKIPKGVLLVGPPGTGKTLLARAVAGEAGVPFYSISGSEFVEMFVGVGAARVRDMFESAKKEAPCVIFIDEIDAVGRSRGAGIGGGHDEREQTLNQILNEMDGFTPHQNVVVLAATNRPDVLDQALLRPGRFDRKVFLQLPDREARKAILKVHMRGLPVAEDVDVEKLAGRTIGFSGADLENLVNEAALFAGRERKESVDMAMFDRARDKLVLGAERERGLGEEERRLVAYHESGHALMAWLLPKADPLEKVTIIPRGRALGATEQLPEEERTNLRRSYLLDRIGVMLGGRVAEQVVFGDVSSGAESDLEQATRLVRRMVCRWGMSEAIGPVAFKRGQEQVFLGRELAEQPDFSDATAKLIDDEIKRVLDEAERRDRELMESHRKALDRLAETLLEEETIGRDRIERLLGREAGSRQGPGERQDSERHREPEAMPRTGTHG